MIEAATEPIADDVRWLFDLLGADVDAEPRPFLARPSLDAVQLLVPTTPGAVAAGSLRRLHGGRDLRGRAEMWAGRSLGRLGQLAKAPGEAVSIPHFELVDHLARALGEPELVAAVTLGPPRRNRKPVLQLLRPDGRVAGFAKVGWSPLTAELVTNEADVLREIEGRLPAPIVAPSVMTVEHWRGLVVVVTSELRPSAAGGRRRSTNDVIRAISTVERTTPLSIKEMPTVREGRDLGLGDRIELDRFLDRHGNVVLKTGLWHGDFTPWNLLRKGKTTLIWDWEFAGWDRPFGFDALHHRFEDQRRRPDGTNRMALAAVVDQAANIVRALQPRINAAQLRALVDLYLAELINRELRLADQRWSGGALATLAEEAATVLEERLA